MHTQQIIKIAFIVPTLQRTTKVHLGTKHTTECKESLKGTITYLTSVECSYCTILLFSQHFYSLQPHLRSLPSPDPHSLSLPS